MRRIGHVIITMLLACALFWGAGLRAEQVTVFAAASLKTVLDTLRDEFETGTGHKLRLVYAGSSVLARQIGQGAPADVFISANTDWMDVLEKQGNIRLNSRVNLLSNRLVLIAAEDGPLLPPAALVGTQGRIAMGLVEAVPAGIYGKQTLQTLGIWNALKPRVVQSDNVRAALALVARREADFGIVYQSDARAEPRVFQRWEFARRGEPAIIYPASLMPDASAAAAEYLEFLQSSEARKTFSEQGFETLGLVK
ncbi:molybdate ABC transporter substrate-binding protein [Lentibacter algarum]|uniref:molybdate ABC transporter substrate-binding protein n=1 Tax=Lentibacter algarum TaxID=576131 RepID=UPI001C07C463|nr:molybdate ABC transporter substrate-binding protein [Lentibacter algarum]MBU2981011.1 molybdate ABC transporter substrate-binding protein [Lentibacter algarum]